MIHVIERTSDPVSAPTKLGQHYLNTTTKQWWTSVGTSTVADWVLQQDTGLINPMTTEGDLIVGGVAGVPERLPANAQSSLLFLGSINGSTPSYMPMAVQGNLSYYSTDSLNSPAEFIFEIASATASAGDTYTNNGQTFTVLKTIASETRVFMPGTGAPTASGNLVRATGSGTNPIVFSSVHPIYVQSTTPQVAKTSHVHTGVTNGQMIHAFISPVGYPNLTYIASGEISYHVHAARTAGTKDCQIRLELWETADNCTPIAKIADLGPSGLLTGSEAEYFISYQMPTNYTMASASSRLMILNFAVVGSSGSIPTITSWVGDGADTHLGISAGSVDVTTFVPYTGATKAVDLNPYNITANNLSGTNTGDQVPTTSVFTTNINWATLGKTGGLYTLDLTADTTLTFSNVTSGYCVNARIYNPASWILTLPTVIWVGTAYTSMPTGKNGIFSFFSDGFNVFGVFALEP